MPRHCCCDTDGNDDVDDEDLSAVVLVDVAVVTVVTSAVVVALALALTSGRWPMLVQVVPTELSSRLLPHELLCPQQNRTHGAVRLSAPAVLQ